MGKVAERQAKVRAKVLVALRRGWSISGSARYADISRRQLKKWMEEDPIFAAECEDAREEGIDGLEDVGRSRAKRRSDTLLMYFLNADRRDKFNPPKEAVSIAPIEVHVKRFSK